MHFHLPTGDRSDSIARLIRHLHTLDAGKKWRVSVEEEKRKRSDAQNRTLWGVIYPPIMEHCGLRGERDRQDLHSYWCGEFFGWSEYELLGRKKVRPRRTTTTDEDGRRSVLSKSEFMAFCDFIKERMAEQGVVIPDPDPAYLEDAA